MGLLFYSILFFLNIAAFGLYAADKYLAMCGWRRIPEAVLLGSAVVGGAYGALGGMLLFRHKTLHDRFRITVPVCFAAWMILLAIVCCRSGVIL